MAREKKKKKKKKKRAFLTQGACKSRYESSLIRHRCFMGNIPVPFLSIALEM